MVAPSKVNSFVLSPENIKETKTDRNDRVDNKVIGKAWYDTASSGDQFYTT